jgi:hypothetical protein
MYDMDMPTMCDQCGEIKDFAEFRHDPNGSGHMFCPECCNENEGDVLDYRGLPKCCLECSAFNDGWNEVTGSEYYCSLGLKLPVKKGSCKRQC